VYPTAELTKGDVPSHYLHDIVMVTKPGTALSEAAVRRAVASVDPNMPVISVTPLRQQVAGRFSQQRLIARLTSFFGILSLILASIGIYGVTAYNASRRVGEIGLRIALGANRGQVVSLMLRGAFGLIALGLLIGLPLTLESGQVLGSELYGMSPYNVAVTVISVAALGFAAFLASLIPALRASRISPIEALRAE
jgi:ABC-type antimicrobial peptide transport system permease subunit